MLVFEQLCHILLNLIKGSHATFIARAYGLDYCQYM